jgi:hypothetical protein
VNVTLKTASLYVGLVFASGIALGAITDHLYVTMSTKPSPSESYRQTYVAKTQSRLHLTDKQVAELTQIMDQTRSQVREVQEKMLPELRAITQRQNERIREMLSPEQNAEFDKLLQEQKQKQRLKKDRR